MAVDVPDVPGAPGGNTGSGLAVTGAENIVPLGLMGLVVLLGGTGLLLIARKRRLVVQRLSR